MTPEQRQAWLAERRTGIGGSDAPVVVGMSKWKTPLELYLDKRGELETPETEPMKWGNLLEPVVRQEYANRTGNTVEVPPGLIRHPTITFAIVTPDGLVPDKRRYYEGKTARTADGWGEPGTDEVPQDYLIQTQHGMLVTGMEVADIAVLIGGQDFRIYTVEADRELQDMLIEQEREFWRHVERGEPPAPVNREDVRRRWRVSSGAKIGAEPDIAETAQQLAIFKALANAADAKAEELSAVIQEYMRDAAELTSGGDILATWKNINASPRFDAKRFAAEQPELYKSYLRDAEPQRRFLLKLKGESPCLEHLLRPTLALPTAAE